MLDEEPANGANGLKDRETAELLGMVYGLDGFWLKQR